jgi:RNA polymerase sigma-70 factor (ECF subfamily)
VEDSLRVRVRSGDPAAFEQLYEDHARVVYRHAVRVTGDRTTAEDVVSLTFLEAWRVREKLHADGDSLRPWLLGIATNVLRNTARAARRHRAAMARLPVREPLPDFADELVSRMTDAEQLAAARAALSHLRPAEQEVFTLCVWAGLSPGEVAQALGVAPGTVRSRLSRARTKLRRLTERQLVLERGNRLQRPAVGGQIPGGRAGAARSMQEDTR